MKKFSFKFHGSSLDILYECLDAGLYPVIRDILVGGTDQSILKGLAHDQHFYRAVKVAFYHQMKQIPFLTVPYGDAEFDVYYSLNAPDDKEELSADDVNISTVNIAGTVSSVWPDMRNNEVFLSKAQAAILRKCGYCAQEG